MRYLISLGCISLVALLWVLVGRFESSASVEVIEVECDKLILSEGEFRQLDSSIHLFNNSSVEKEIISASSSCSCLVTSKSFPILIPSKQSVEIPIQVSIGNRIGTQQLLSIFKVDGTLIRAPFSITIVPRPKMVPASVFLEANEEKSFSIYDYCANYNFEGNLNPDEILSSLNAQSPERLYFRLVDVRIASDPGGRLFSRRLSFLAKPLSTKQERHSIPVRFGDRGVIGEVIVTDPDEIKISPDVSFVNVQEKHKRLEFYISGGSIDTEDVRVSIPDKGCKYQIVDIRPSGFTLIVDLTLGENSALNIPITVTHRSSSKTVSVFLF